MRILSTTLEGSNAEMRAAVAANDAEDHGGDGGQDIVNRSKQRLIT